LHRELDVDDVLVVRQHQRLAQHFRLDGVPVPDSLPYSVPEAIVFLAGLAGMPIRKFILALTIGSLPTAFAFAAIGARWANQPILVLVVSYVIPIFLLPIALYFIRLRAQQ
jgi:uncharacterized membrane protein YdjX (TVP38/TMEM64 family)